MRLSNLYLTYFIILFSFFACKQEETKESKIQKFSNWRFENSGKGFKQFLKSKNIDLSGKIQNEFEDIQEGNLYSNQILNFSIDLPDNWQVDRGTQPSTVIRAFQRDSAMTLTVNVIKWNEKEEIKKNVNPNTISYLDSINSGNYIENFTELLQGYSRIKPLNVKYYEFHKYNTDFIATTFLSKHVDQDWVFYMKHANYTTTLFNMTYTLTFASLEEFYDEEKLLSIISTFRISQPIFQPN